jgi:hypothetical protein
MGRSELIKESPDSLATNRVTPRLTLLKRALVIVVVVVPVIIIIIIIIIV